MGNFSVIKNSIKAPLFCVAVVLTFMPLYIAFKTDAHAQVTRQNLFVDPYGRFRALFPNSVSFAQGDLRRKNADLITEDWLYSTTGSEVMITVSVIDFDDSFAMSRSNSVAGWVASRAGLELLLGSIGNRYEIDQIRRFEAFGRPLFELTAHLPGDSGRFVVVYAMSSATRSMTIVLSAATTDALLGLEASRFTQSFEVLKLED